jgi:DNA-binding NarL/FixJ family response regulator
LRWFEMAHSRIENAFSGLPADSEAGRVSKPTILLADDHPGFPDIVEVLLRPKFEVIGKVVDGQALFDAAIRLKPDVIVTDISMPVLDGITTADRLKESGCASRIVFLTVHSDPDFVRACLATGAFGYVVKSRIHTELVTAIRHALDGQLFISENLTPLKEE